MFIGNRSKIAYLTFLCLQ
ncbi:hypothetical protein F383_10821 [Gossypium arboreum]|uniref:Uncharacterized protein n=1 Tax=Gossypium arboreum TaxID=29729 RepID=A0A0B0NG47_GOSAR|nr:hypothetical protein F383_10821 [Gossypium arboreum]